jgi:hypothetical protein
MGSETLEGPSWAGEFSNCSAAGDTLCLSVVAIEKDSTVRLQT